MLDTAHRIKRSEGHVLIPVTSKDALELGYQQVDEELQEREPKDTDYRQLVKVPEDLRDLLPVSFNIIGDVAIVRLEGELTPYSKDIGEAMMRTFPRLRVIAMDKGVKGELRVRDLHIMAGGDTSETVHMEYGIKLLIDPSKAYFNPRLANERKRIATLVKDGETVVDMFAGVGPFSIMIAKYARPEVIFAMDLNHDAIEYMKKNIELNKVTNIVPMEDASELIFEVPCADRIVMNLPHSAFDFFADALTRLKLGGTIHIYTICENEDIEAILLRQVIIARGMGIKLCIDRQEALKTYSPSMSVFSADLTFADWA